MTAVNKSWSCLPEMRSVLDLLPKVDLCFMTMETAVVFIISVTWSNTVNEDQL